MSTIYAEIRVYRDGDHYINHIIDGRRSELRLITACFDYVAKELSDESRVKINLFIERPGRVGADDFCYKSITVEQ